MRETAADRKAREERLRREERERWDREARQRRGEAAEAQLAAAREFARLVREEEDRQFEEHRARMRAKFANDLFILRQTDPEAARRYEERKSTGSRSASTSAPSPMASRARSVAGRYRLASGALTGEWEVLTEFASGQVGWERCADRATADRRAQARRAERGVRSVKIRQMGTTAWN